MMCIGTLALYLIYQLVLWTLQIGARQFIFLLLIIHCLVNLSARKDRINLILNLQYTENTLLSHFMEIYISSLFFYLCIQLIPLNSKYLVWVKLCIYLYAHLQTPDLSADFVLWNLVFLYVSCLCCFFFLTNHNLWFVFWERLYFCIPPQHILLTAVIALKKAYVPLFFSRIWLRWSIWFSVKPFSYLVLQLSWQKCKKVGCKMIQWVRGSKRIKVVSLLTLESFV